MQYTLSHDELFKRCHDKELSEYAREHYFKTLKYRADCGNKDARLLVAKIEGGKRA